MKDSDDEERTADSESVLDMSTENSGTDCETCDDSNSDFDSESDDYELPWYWQTVVDEANDRHEEERKAMIEKLVSEGEAELTANQIACEKLIPVLKKELRKILSEKLEWMHAIKKDYYFKKILNTRRELLDSGDYDWNEATKLAIRQRKFLLDHLIPSQNDEESDESMESST